MKGTTNSSYNQQETQELKALLIIGPNTDISNDIMELYKKILIV
ncbi:MAG: hypothetical protein RCG15_03455 [Candidatus Rickettsia vulgarisii]